MNELLELAMEAHGGIDHWNSLSAGAATMKLDGALWQVKGVPDFAATGHLKFNLHEQIYSLHPFLKEGQKSSFKNDQIVIQTMDGKVLKELVHPRDTFDGHTLETPWEDIQLAYFNAYAGWAYFTLPFILSTPGFKVTEVDGRIEDGAKWRALDVVFPDHLHYHSKLQTLYFSADGLLRRLDYDVDIAKGARAAHYVYDYQEFNGIMVPTKRLVWPPDQNNDPNKDLLLVSAEVSAVSFI